MKRLVMLALIVLSGCTTFAWQGTDFRWTVQSQDRRCEGINDALVEFEKIRDSKGTMSEELKEQYARDLNRWQDLDCDT